MVGVGSDTSKRSYVSHRHATALGFAPRRRWSGLSRLMITGADGSMFLEEVIASTICGESLKQCLKCETCSESCPSGTDMDHTPQRLFALITAGKRDEVLHSNTPWYCVSCSRCVVHCPQEIPIRDLMYALKGMSVREGLFDEIQQDSNPLPGWWLWFIWGMIIFSLIYVPYHHMFENGPFSGEAYLPLNEDVELRSPGISSAVAGSSKSAEKMTAVSKDPVDTIQGRKVYRANCAPCHGASGEGGIGPNLTDNYWLHGNTPDDMFRLINEGVLEKGMVSWKTLLSSAKIWNVIAFIQTLRDTKPFRAKPPQGIEYSK